jgi:peptidoglycan/xylan/chitin deacetylase (PgdA/CDA1 family)
VTFTEATRMKRGKRLAVTFDDGFASVLELGKPILDRLGVPATIYVVSDFAETGAPLLWDGIDQWKGGPFDQELRSLGWEQLRALADEGWEVGSHTCDHPRLTGCDDAELDRQLAVSRAAVERGMGRPCTSICYPYGDVDRRVADAAGRAGYEAGATLPARWHRAEPLLWPRVGIWHGDDERRFGLKTSPLVRRVRRIVDPILPDRSA